MFTGAGFILVFPERGLQSTPSICTNPCILSLPSQRGPVALPTQSVCQALGDCTCETLKGDQPTPSPGRGMASGPLDLEAVQSPGRCRATPETARP